MPLLYQRSLVLKAPVFLACLYFGWTQNLEALILTGLLTMTLKLWFIDRMARLAEDLYLKS